MLSLPPAGWVEELSRELRPDAFAPGTHGRGLHVALTYRTDLPDLLERQGHTLQAVVTDLSAGFTIEPRSESGGRESYRLIGSRFVVTVSQLPASEPGRTVAVVGSVDPIDLPDPTDAAARSDRGVLIVASVSFHLPYEERPYDVAALHAITEETEAKREAARRQVAQILSDPAALAPAPVSPRERLRTRYTGLAMLLELLGAGYARQREVLDRFLDQPATPDTETLVRFLDDPATVPVDTAAHPAPPALTGDGTGRLDPAQAGAVAAACSARHAFAIAGPPAATGDTVVELVRRLAAGGERVLVTAATRERADAILRDAGAGEGVFAVRLAGDDPTPPDLLDAVPAALPDHLAEAARTPSTARTPQWETQIARLTGERDLLRAHLAARTRLNEARARSQEAVQALEAWENAYQEKRQAVAAHLQQLQQQLTAAQAALDPARQAEQQTAAALAAAKANRDLADRLAGLIRTGETARLAREHRRAVKARKAAENTCHTLAAQLQQTQEQLRDILRQGPPERERHELTCAERARAVAEARRNVEAGAEAIRSILGADTEPTDAELDEHARRRDDEAARLTRYTALERRWFELTAADAGGPPLAHQLVRAAHLVCCTHADIDRLDPGPTDPGTATAPDFDTLVVDEAARLHDSEFLAAAVHARRWILVGDDTAAEAPTGLASADEHALLAAAALATTLTDEEESATGEDRQIDPEAMVARLRQWWPEDAPFPAEGTAAALRRLTGDPQWRDRVAQVVQAARTRTADPAAALVRDVHAYRRPDLFVRSLTALPAPLRRRLAAAAPREGE